MTMNTTITADRMLTLGEAVKLTGFSAGKFRYNKQKLVQHGVVVNPEGWVIPVAALRELGWLGVKPSKGEVKETPLAKAQARIAELEAEVAELRQHNTRPRLFGRRK